MNGGCLSAELPNHDMKKNKLKSPSKKLINRIYSHYLFIAFLLFMVRQPAFAQEKKTSGYWISTAQQRVNKPNTWIAFRRDIIIKNKTQQALTTIAADTKYWLWINGNQIRLLKAGAFS